MHLPVSVPAPLFGKRVKRGPKVMYEVIELLVRRDLIVDIFGLSE
jgi:hypothetical protein